MKHYIYIFLTFALGTLVLLSCSDQHEHTQNRHELSTQVDFLQQFHQQQQQETTLVDFSYDAEPGKYLLHRWADPGKHSTWSIGMRSNLLFYRYDTAHDVELKILGRAFPSIDGIPQTTDVLVNGQNVSTLTISTDEVKEYDVIIPANTLRSGSNLLEFRFSYRTRPGDLDPNSTDFRRLSVAFYKIFFSPSGNLTYGEEATQVIDFRQGASSSGLLVSGWGDAERDRRWTTSTASRVQFYAYGQKSLKLKLICETLPSMNEEKQEVAVRLNDAPAATFTIKPTSFKTYSITLPGDRLRFGLNQLDFHASYSSKPADVLEDSDDTRDLSIAFQQILFKNNPMPEVAGQVSIRQTSHSNMSLIHELSDEFDFELTYDSTKGARPLLLLTHDGHEPISIPLASGRKTHRESIKLPEAGLYKIQLASEGEPGSSTEWEGFYVSESSLATSFTQPMASQAPAFSKTSAPDIVLYVVDTLRRDHLGCYGYDRDTSPNLDRFARENTIFTNAYSPVSWTKPSAASIVSGLLPKNHKTMSKKAKLPDEILTLAEILQANGYYTVAYTANGNFGKTFGFSQGFDEFNRFVDRQPVTLSEMSDRINEDLLPFLEKYAAQKDRKPLFLIVWTMDPHDPYTPDDSVKDMFNIQQYEEIDTYDSKFLFKVQAGEIKPTASQIEFIKTRYDQEIFFNDRSFGEMLTTMKSTGLYDDAFVLFTSDHGEEFWDHGGTGHGRTLYNEQVRMPFVLKAPQVSVGSNSRLTQHIDIYPTLLDIAGIEAPYRLDGVSILTPSPPERRIFFEQEFDRSIITASLDLRKKTIFTRKYHRPGTVGHVAPFEVFHFDDTKEEQNLGINSIEDEFRFHEIFSFLKQESSFSLQKTEVVIPPELDEHLKELGYVQ